MTNFSKEKSTFRVFIWMLFAASF